MYDVTEHIIDRNIKEEIEDDKKQEKEECNYDEQNVKTLHIDQLKNHFLI